MQNVKSFLYWAGFVLIIVGIVVLLQMGIARNVNGQEDRLQPIMVEDLKDFERDLTDREGGFRDIREDSRRQDTRIQNVWEYTNSVDKRLHELENKQSNNTAPKKEVAKQKEVVAMISNEGGQSFSYSDGSVENKNQCRPIHTKRKNFETSALKEYMEYAYKLGGMPFVLMLNAENGSRDPKRQSSVPDRNGANGKEDSRGFCQLHRNRHAYVVDDERFFTDWRRQMEQCYRKFAGGTRFYGADVKHQRGGNIKEVCE